MSIRYKFSKCKYIAFIKSKENISRLSKPITNYITPDQLDNQSKTEHFSLFIDSHDEMFSDVIFKIDEETAGLSSSNKKDSTDVAKTVITDGSSQLDAFNAKTFIVNRGKKSANITNIHPKQNHDVIDSIARNGILCEPMISSKVSIGKLFNKLSQFPSFDIIIYNRDLVEDIRENVMPSEYIEPIYVIGKGEITAVFYRYICMYFFGYMSVFDEFNREHNYDL